MAIIVADAEAIADWYASVFYMKTAQEISTESAKNVLLKGDVRFVVIIEFGLGAPEYVNRSEGIFKAGFSLSSFDEKVAAWRAKSVKFFGNGKAFYNDALAVHSIIPLDPDGNKFTRSGPVRQPKQSKSLPNPNSIVHFRKKTFPLH